MTLLTDAVNRPGMPIWLSRVGEVPPGLEPLDNLPWDVIAPHEAQAQRNHSQSLKQIKSRGGLSVKEAACIVSDEPYRNIPLVIAIHRLAAAVEAAKADSRGWRRE